LQAQYIVKGQRVKVKVQRLQLEVCVCFVFKDLVKYSATIGTREEPLAG